MPKDDGMLSVIAMWVLIILATSFGASGRGTLSGSTCARMLYAEAARYPAPVGVGNSFSGSFGTSLEFLAHEAQDGLAVALELGLPDAVDAEQGVRRLRLVLGDQLEGGVGEHDVGGHALLCRLARPPGAQLLEEVLVVGGRAVTAAAPLLLGSGAQRPAALTAA